MRGTERDRGWLLTAELFSYGRSVGAFVALASAVAITVIVRITVKVRRRK